MSFCASLKQKSDAATSSVDVVEDLMVTFVLEPIKILWLFY